MFSSGIAVQGVPRARRSVDGETEAEKDPHHIHVGPTQGTGTGVPGDTLSRYIHERRNRHEDRLDRGESTGKRKQT